MKEYQFALISLAILLSIPFTDAQLPITPNGKFETVNGATIYYEEYGQGEPLLLLHGFARTLEDWKTYVPEFSKNYRVITWDMRGHGRSTNPDTSQVFLHATAARDLLALLEKLNLDKVKAIGHSSGGIIILYAAIMEPERFEAIVPVCAQMYYGPQVRAFIEANAKPEASYEFNGMERLHGAAKGRLLARQFFHFRELYGDPSITPDQLATIKARTLLVHGDNDFVPVAQSWVMYQHIPGAHLLVIPNGWHLPHFGGLNEKDFIRRVSEFLSGEWNKKH